jgi:hypothetical protein
MVADEHQVPAATAQTGKIAMKDDLTKWMNRFQSVGIDKDLLHIRSIGFQGIDQLMGGGAVEIPVEGEVDTIAAFMLEYPEIHGHRLSSFPPPGAAPLVDDRYVTPEEVKRREAQPRQLYFRSATIDSPIFTGTPIRFRMPPHTKPISNDGAILNHES